MGGTSKDLFAVINSYNGAIVGREIGLLANVKLETNNTFE